MKVIFHIEHPEKWSVVRNNVTNFLAEIPDATIEILVNGQAAGNTVKKSGIDLSNLTEITTIKVCENALAARGISPDKLQENLQTVKSGVVELAVQQQNEFAYIKP